jgi:hypothetical protein
VDKKIAKEEVERWLEANGVEPSSHEIVFVN